MSEIKSTRGYRVIRTELFNTDTVTPPGEFVGGGEVETAFGGYTMLQIAALGSVTLEVWGRLDPSMPYAKIDTLTVSTGDGLLKSYFEVPYLTFRITAVTGGVARGWIIYDGG